MTREELLNELKSLKQDMNFIEGKYKELLLQIEKYLIKENEQSN